MKKELEEQIIAIAPYMFRYEGWNDLSISLLSFGFDGVPDNWYDLLYNLVLNLSKLDVGHTLEVFQVKEKFNGLRFYVNIAATKEMNDLIYKAENDSLNII